MFICLALHMSTLEGYLDCFCNEEHAVFRGGKLKCMRLVENVLSAFDGQALIHLHRNIHHNVRCKYSKQALLLQ